MFLSEKFKFIFVHPLSLQLFLFHSFSMSIHDAITEFLYLLHLFYKCILIFLLFLVNEYSKLSLLIF